MNEFSIQVDNTDEKENAKREKTHTRVLKGAKTVFHERGDGYEIEDIVEITLTVKCAMKETLQMLTIEEIGQMKLMSLRDRDLTLRSFEKPVPAAQRKIV